MKRITATGKTIKDAVRAGLTQLGVAEDRVRVHVLEQPSKGLFGLIGSKEAKVELELLSDAAAEAPVKGKDPQPHAGDAIQKSVNFLKDILDGMGVSDYRIDHRPDEDEATLISISGNDMGIVIGRRGQTLDALQYLINVAANRKSDTHVRILLDAERFRERRKKTLEELAERLSERAVRTRREVVLEAMTPHERKVIHYYLQDHPKVKTYSKGEEPNRRVVIALR